MSFWQETHPLQDQYEILWKRYVPGMGESNNNTAESMRLVAGIYYQLHNNGSWFGTNNYHVKEYLKNSDVSSPADGFINNLNWEYNNLNYEEDTEDNETLDERCEIMDDIMGEVVEWVWDNLADNKDRKELAKRQRKKNAKKNKEIKLIKNAERLRKKIEKNELLRLKKLYKSKTGKRFRIKNNSNLTHIECLKNWEKSYIDSILIQ